MTTVVCKKKSQYTDHYTDHFFPKYWPNTDHFFPKYQKILTNIESPILKNFAGINFRESTFSGVKKGIYFREFGQISKNSWNFLLAKISSLKVIVADKREQLGGSFNGCSESSPSVQVCRQYPLPQICIMIFRENADLSNRTPRDLTTLYGRQVCCANVAR